METYIEGSPTQKGKTMPNVEMKKIRAYRDRTARCPERNERIKKVRGV